MTNSPIFAEQLQNVRQYQGLEGDKLLPGSTDPADRFVRATYYIANMPKSTSYQDELTKLMSIMENTAQPDGIVTSERPIVASTIWRVISDLNNKVYYFNSALTHTMFHAQLDKFNLQPGSPVMKLDLQNRADLIGDVSQQFKPFA